MIKVLNWVYPGFPRSWIFQRRKSNKSFTSHQSRCQVMNNIISKMLLNFNQTENLDWKRCWRGKNQLGHEIFLIKYFCVPSIPCSLGVCVTVLSFTSSFLVFFNSKQQFECWLKSSALVYFLCHFTWPCTVHGLSMLLMCVTNPIESPITSMLSNDFSRNREWRQTKSQSSRWTTHIQHMNAHDPYTHWPFSLIPWSTSIGCRSLSSKLMKRNVIFHTPTPLDNGVNKQRQQ